MRRIRCFTLLLALGLVGCGVSPMVSAPILMEIATASSTPKPSLTIPPTLVPSLTKTPTLLPSPTSTATAIPPTPDERQYSVNISSIPVWDSPSCENQYWHLETELLLGEKVLVLKRQGEWARIAAVEQPSQKDALGYPGWVRYSFLSPGWAEASQFAVVMVPTTLLRAEAGGVKKMTLNLDTRLAVISEQDAWVQVLLPDGTTGWITRADIRLSSDLSQPIEATGMFKLAERFIGTPYKWGGTTSKALDCAGFTYRLFHAYGIQIGRDAGDQTLNGDAVTREDLIQGDLIIAPESPTSQVLHVVFFWGNGMILDSSFDKGVSLRPFSQMPGVHYWVAIRRILP